MVDELQKILYYVSIVHIQLLPLHIGGRMILKVRGHSSRTVNLAMLTIISGKFEGVASTAK